jgi:hypothetical protein
MLVYIRQTWGQSAGMVDDERLYSVRSCGPKKAILDPVDKTTGQPFLDGYRRRGHTLHLASKEYAEQQNARNGLNGYRHFYYWDWSQMLVPQGEAGWDPSQNF